MSIETHTPLQIDMFTGERVDTRSPAQKQRDRERARPQQTEMFAPSEIAQFGVNPRPLIHLSPHTRLTLSHEDSRTAEEIERDQQRAPEENTYQMFDTACKALLVRSVLALIVYEPPQRAIILYS
ncbi:hypothetical protein ACFLYO_10460 [Chloroflexota bacterium]